MLAGAWNLGWVRLLVGGKEEEGLARLKSQKKQGLRISSF